MYCHAITMPAIAMAAMAVLRNARNRTLPEFGFVHREASATGPTSRSRRRRRSGTLPLSECASSKGGPIFAFIACSHLLFPEIRTEQGAGALSNCAF